MLEAYIVIREIRTHFTRLYQGIIPGRRERVKDVLAFEEGRQ
jgi:hypothetical protein